jgi:uncharacterized membrane protein
MRRRSSKLLAGAFAVVAVAVLSFAIGRDRCTPVSGVDAVRISLAKLLPGHASTFCYTDDAGSKIRFVLARGNDGKVHSVFDACRQCYVYHKGYAVSGGDLICRVCGNRYPIDRMTKGKASCVPVGLPHREEGGGIIVKIADLLAGRPFF